MRFSHLRLFRAAYVAIAIALLSAHAVLAESPIRQLTTTTSSNLRPAWSSDGQRIAFQTNRDSSDGSFGIYVMDRDGKNARRISDTSNDDRHPAWSPDGKRLAVDSGTAHKREIWLIDLASGKRTQLTRLGAIASFPSWSPDGTRITFYIYQGGEMDLWVVAPDGGRPTQLTRSLASEDNNQCTFACHAVSWAPDSSGVALADGDHARVLLMRSLVESASLSPVSPEGERSHFPIYLADGRITYVTEHLSLENSWTDLWLLDPKTGERTELAKDIKAQGPFELSSDGRQLLFASPRSGNFEIYAVTLDDAGKAALTIKSLPGTPASADAPAVTGLPFELSLDMLVLGAIGLLIVGLEAVVFMRRRAARREPSR